MLTIKGRYGVVESSTGRILVPLDYKSITLQKYGIVAECDNSSSDIYSFDGTPLLKAYNKVLLLEDHLLLTANDSFCVLIDYYTHNLIGTVADSILFFYGNKEKAETFSTSVDISKILSDPAYVKYGAHLEERIAIQSSQNHKWGIWNRFTNSLSTDFLYPHMVQATEDRIMVRKDNTPTML